RAQRRAGLPLFRLPGGGRHLSHLWRHRMDRVGWLRDGQPRRLPGLRHRPRPLHRLCVRHGHRAGLDAATRGQGHARDGRGRRALQHAVRDGDLMRAPVSWLREYVEGAPVGTGREVAASLARVGLEEEALHGGDITGPLVVGRVLELVEEPQKNGKTIRWCQVDVGRHGQRVTEGTPQGVVCGALNFAVGDLVVVVIPGAVLPGGISIGARKTYGHVSNGMICSARELGLGEEGDGIIVLQSLLGEEAAARLTPGDDAIELLGLGDEVVEVTVTPDRGYCLSMRGIAREYTHATGGTLRDPAAITSAAANTSGYAVQLA